MFCFLNSTYKWDHTVFLWFISLSIMLSRSFHVVANSRISMFNIWVTFHCVCVCIYTHIYMTFFIHSSIDGHLGCFDILAIVNEAPMNVCFVLFSHYVVSDSFATPWTIACQTPLSMGFPRQQYWGKLPFPSPGDLPNPGIESTSPSLAADSLPLSH